VAGSGETLADQLQRFIAAGKLIMGVCNGFQLMVKMGLLPALGGDYRTQSATLTINDGGRFEDRWCELAVDPASRASSPGGSTGSTSRCATARGNSYRRRGGAGRHRGAASGGTALLRPGSGAPTMDYPWNPMARLPPSPESAMPAAGCSG